MKTSAKQQKIALKYQQGPHPHAQDKRDFHAHNDFFLVSDSYGQAQSKFSLSGRAWVGSVSSQRGKCLLRNRPNGVSKWCMSEHGLGTAGEQFNDLSGSAGESQGCSFPHKLFQGDGLKPGVPVTCLIVAMRHIPGISASSCRSGTWGPPGHPAQTPTADGAFPHCCLCSSLRLLVLCQGMKKIWVLTLRLQAPPNLPGEGLTLFLHALLHHVWAVSVWTRWRRRPLEVWGLLDQWCYLLLPERWWHLTPLGCDPPEGLSPFWSQRGLLKGRHFCHQFLRCISPWDPRYGWTAFLIYV